MIQRTLSRFGPLALLLIALAAPLHAQRGADTTRRADSVQAPAVNLAPPIGPRRAFLYSFLVPGYSQTVLGRHKAAATFLLVEAISIAMIRESGADVREARRFQNDTLIISYTDGSRALDPPAKTPGRFGNNEVRSRRAHVEDWAAFLVANHLFAGADAFVAAHLWDLPKRLSVRVVPNGETTVVAASFKW